MRSDISKEEYINLPKSTRHTAFYKKQPTNTEIKVWRFVNLFKFLCLLEYQQLRFARIDSFRDPYEGAIPSYHHPLPPNATAKEVKEYEARIERMVEQKKRIFASCWYIDDRESDAMWNLYCDERDGIAMKTSYGRLQQFTESLNPVESSGKFYIGKINYINYTQQNFPSTNGFEYFMHKRQSFEHEKEVRILTGAELADGQAIEGLSVPFKAKEILEAVYVHPLAKQEFYQLIISVTARYAPSLPVEWSSMRDEKGTARTNAMKFRAA